MGNGGSLNAIYAGRFVAGLGVGQTVVVGPVYIAEIVSSVPIGNTRANANCPGTGGHSRTVHFDFYRLHICGHCPGLLHQLRRSDTPGAFQKSMGA